MSSRIDQLLFGYRDGHELLAGSISVEPRLQARLLPHTDARFDDKSRHYLVGVPVPDLERYLLVRIWPAPEIARPGAVWAHALLIEPRLLRKADPKSFAALFRRPQDVEDFSAYGKPLAWSSNGARERMQNLPPSLALALSQAIYDSEQKPAVVIWRLASDAEDGLLAAWYRLPADERLGFSFRTRGKARSGAGPYFLQVASALGGRSESSSAVALVDARRPPAEPGSPWIPLIAEATQDPDTPFGEFLTTYAQKRSDFAVLGDLWPKIESEDPSEALTDLSSAAPKAGAMKALKQELFGVAEESQGLWRVAEIDRLRCLLASEESAFSLPALRVPERVSALWDGAERGAVLELLDTRRGLPTQSAQLMLDSAIPKISEEELLGRVDDRELLVGVGRRRPDLLEAASLWGQLAVRDARSILEALPGALEDPKILDAILDAGAYEPLSGMLHDERRVLLVATALSKRGPEDLRTWRCVFDDHEFELATALENASRVPAACLVLAFAFLDVAQANRLDWQRMLSAAKQTHRRGDTVAVLAAARLFARALPSKNPAAGKIMVETFGPLHFALESEFLSDRRALKELDRALPDRKSKSQAKRLRQALVLRMEAERWKRADFERALEHSGVDPEKFMKLVEKKHPGRRLIEKVLSELTAPLRG